MACIATSVEASPLHIYHFDTSYVDGSGCFRTPDLAGGADAILKNGASVAGGQLVLDGINDFVILPSIVTGAAFAIEARLRIPANRSQIQSLAATGSPTADAPGWKLFINKFNYAGPGAIGFESGDGRLYGGRQAFSAPGTFRFSDWEYHSIRSEVDKSTPGAQQVKTYYDGSLVATGGAADFDEGPTDIWIGAMKGGTWFLGGSIEELAITPEPCSLALLLGGALVAIRCRHVRAWPGS
jgi:hypothetical protein